MVVAISALVFSLAGTGVASVATISTLTHKERKQARSIADSEVNKLAPGLSVKSARLATAAGSADTAASATNADLLDGHDATAFQRQGGITVTSGTTPSVTDVNELLLSYASPVVITDFTGASNGKVIALTAGNSNVDINDCGNFGLAGNVNWTPSTGDTLLLVKSLGDQWWELSRSDN